MCLRDYLHSRLYFPEFLIFALLNSAICFAQQTERQDAPPNTSQSSAPDKQRFLKRWADFYRQDWWGATTPGPGPRRRGVPSPLDSPPFPNADWSYGGSPVIGE